MTPEEKYTLHLPYRPKGKWVDLGADKRTKEGRGISCSIVGLSYFTHLKNPQIVVNDKSGLGYSNIEELTPYFRSFDQLTKECVQADYNDGKPFVPVEWFENENNCEIDYFADNLQVKMLFNDGNICDLELLPFGLVKQLLKWHFAIGFEKGEYIEVTDENNPYE